MRGRRLSREMRTRVRGVARLGVVGVIAVVVGGCTAGAPSTGVAIPTQTATAHRAPADSASSAPVVTATTVAMTKATTIPTVAATPDHASGLPTGPAPTPRPVAPADPGSGSAITVDGSGSNDRLQIALTFDAGEDRGYGEAILDYLRDEGITATFGMTGQWAAKYPDLVVRMVNEGHQLMNHSYTHRSFDGRSTGTSRLTSDEVRQELQRTEEIVKTITGGYEMKPYFRFPYQDWDAELLAQIYEAGYYLNIFWTCDTLGWKVLTTAADVARRCTTDALPHEITLLHVGAAAAADYEALPALVGFYREQGYEFVSIEQMLQP